MKKFCSMCSKCGTAACILPDKCVTKEYRYYSSRPLQHWQYCRQCGAKLVTSSTYIETEDIGVEYKFCPNCDLKEKVIRSCYFDHQNISIEKVD